jgi:large repetitive protein
MDKANHITVKPPANSMTHFTGFTAMLTLMLICCMPGQGIAQCGPGVPSYTVNLTGHPDTTWTSPSIGRNGNCCGTTSPDVCIHFYLTLDTGAAGIIFNVTGGTGSTTYSINCSTTGNAGSPVCMTGTGPWNIDYCKPGANPQVYTFRSIPKPTLKRKKVWITSACNPILVVEHLIESTITWSSLSGSAYNANLSCISGCDTTYVTMNSSFPSFVDYRVCGSSILPCYAGGTYCDTVRVTRIDPVLVNIKPDPAVICNGYTSMNISAGISGGVKPFKYLWNTGAATQNITAVPGTYWVKVTDSLNCRPTYDTIEVYPASQIKAEAGNDTGICITVGSISLKGSVQKASGGTWSGGAGTFSPGNTTLNAVYTMSATDKSAGFVILYLTTTGNGSCSPSKDSIRITINPLPAASVISNTAICYGTSIPIGGASVPGSTYSWSSAPAGFSSNSANPAVSPSITTTYTLTETNLNGCVKSNSVTITVNPLPAALVISNSTICNGSSIYIGGNAVAGSTYSWTSNPSGFSSTSSNPTVSPILSTTYTLTETGVNGCKNSNSVTITVIPLPNPAITGNPGPCEYTTGSYFTSNTGNAYLWNVTGGSILSGQGNNSVSVEWDKAGPGQVSVTETNPGTGCKKTVVYGVVIYSRPAMISIFH